MQAFISCTLGIRMVGYVMAARGLATMVSAGLLGWLARFTGRQVLCLLALVSDLALFLVLTWWEPRADQLPVFLGLAALMGLVEGVWAVQVNGRTFVLHLSFVIIESGNVFRCMMGHLYIWWHSFT